MIMIYHDDGDDDDDEDDEDDHGDGMCGATPAVVPCPEPGVVHVFHTADVRLPEPYVLCILRFKKPYRSCGLRPESFNMQCSGIYVKVMRFEPRRSASVGGRPSKTRLSAYLLGSRRDIQEVMNRWEKP